jgi:chorismate mutase
MTEPVMYFGIGFFVATLLGLLIVLRFHHRALRFGSVDQFHADVRQLEQQLAVALAERSRLQREIAAIKRDAETIWAAERVENALFRERINDVAYEVVRITQALESSGSSIEPMSAYAALVIEHGRRTQTLHINSASGEASAPTMHTGALADRIRALRTTASRAAAN